MFTPSLPVYGVYTSGPASQPMEMALRLHPKWAGGYMKFILGLALCFGLATPALACSYCKTAGANLPKSNAATEASKDGGYIVRGAKAYQPQLTDSSTFFKSVDGVNDDEDAPKESNGRSRGDSDITYTNAYGE